MKTNTDISHSGLKNTCARERAFTLTDLLVVMATLAILAAVMLPALARSGDNGARVVCANNLRQMGMALNMYVEENQDTMPWVIWGNSASPPCPRGWLYSPDPNTPNNLYTGNAANDASLWSTGRVANLKTGVYWQYLQNSDVFMCPVDAAANVGTLLWDQRYNKLSTYIMNGASAFFPPLGRGNTYGFRTCKMSQIWSPLCIINWEPNPVGSSISWNDGSSFPDSTEGPSIVLHVTGANVLTVGGSTRFMSSADVLAEMNNPPSSQPNAPKGLLWWNPNQKNGHGVGI
jgi:type II secretory pathway pseudopilin PulG